MRRVLLVDGDVIAFIAAAAVQNTWEDTAGYVWPFANTAEGEAAVENLLHGLKFNLRADDMRVFLTHEVNWRKQLDPEYKANRKDSVRPLLLSRLREYLREKHGAETWANLEADDVVSILGTEDVENETRIICGKDKDFLGIPAPYHRLGDDKGAIVEPTLAEANLFHLAQTLAGDRVDNYTGCPGLGMERAQRLLEDPVVLKPTKGIITRGKNKGQEVTKWVSEPTDDLWACVVSQFLKAGLTEDDALRNARLAYLLRAEDYDQQTGRITLWVPEKLKLKE